jgi:hypothetical protein
MREALSKRESAFGFRIDERSLEQKGVLFSLSILSSRRPDRYFYGIGIESSEDNKSSIPLRMFRVDAKWSIRVSSDLAAEPVIRYRSVKDSYDEQHYTAQPSSNGYSFEKYSRDADRYYSAGLQAIYDNRPAGDFSYSGLVASACVTRVFSESRSIRYGDEYWLYGATLKHHFEIPTGGKSLSLSAKVDGIRIASNRKAPFWDLPTIGGQNLLRGPAWEAFDLKDLKTGYGFELKTDLDDNFAFDFQIAHSREGLQLYVGTSSRLSLLSGEMNR